MTYTEPPEPPTIARLRRALAAWDDTVDWEPTGSLGRPVAYDMVDAARAVLAEWDRGVAERLAAVKAAITEDQARRVMGLRVPAEAVEPWHGKATPSTEMYREAERDAVMRTVSYTTDSGGEQTTRIGRPRCSRCYQVGHLASACTVGL